MAQMNNVDVIVLLMVVICSCLNSHEIKIEKSEENETSSIPLVQIVLLARNKAPILPHFLTHFEALNYPKDRIILYIRADHSQDQTVDIFQDWLETVRDLYYETNVVLDRLPKYFSQENDIFYITSSGYEHVINLKQNALKNAVKKKADYILYLDTDVILTESDMLSNLMSVNGTVVAPNLRSLNEDKYPNFWIYQGRSNYMKYNPGDTYKFIFKYFESCMKVYLVHSCVLIDLRRENSTRLTFDNRKLLSFGHNVIRDDVVTFAVSAQIHNISTQICNHKYYGVVGPPNTGQNLSNMKEELQDLILLLLFHNNLLKVPPVFEKYVGKSSEALSDKIGFDEIYYINLDKRRDRRKRMELLLDILKLNATRVSAVNGWDLTHNYMKSNKIRKNPKFKNPFTEQNVTKGEMGCFLSHYKIWDEVYRKRLSQVLVLEDDIGFHHKFRERIRKIQQDIQRIKLKWDFIYIGRSIVTNDNSEVEVSNSEQLVHAEYSHWTLGYMLSLSGAKKLLAHKPLSNVIPVDLYIASVADTLPLEIKYSYRPRNLQTLSVVKELITPAKIQYVDQDFISDTQEKTVEECSLQRGE